MLSAEVTDWLDGLLDSARASEIQGSQHFRFGARQLNLITLRGTGETNFSAGLIPWGLASEETVSVGAPATLYVLPSRYLNVIPDFSGIQFGPYGSIVGLDSSVNDGDSTGRWLIAIDPDQGRLLALELNARIALLSSFTDLPPREIAEFGRPLLHWLAILDGNVVIHAGAVSDGGRGLLITGSGNAGKTTFVRACREGGMTFHGDNVIEVSPSGDSTRPPHIWGAYKSLKVRVNPVGELPRVGQKSWDDEAKKSIIFLPETEHAPDNESARLVKILTLSRTEGPSFRNISASSAFFATAPNTIAQFPYFEKLVLSRVRETVESVPNITSGHLPYETIAQRTRELLT
jgi:hypothetical protein